MGSRYQSYGRGETISVGMGRLAGLGDFPSQVGALRHDIGMTVRDMATGFADVDMRLVLTVKYLRDRGGLRDVASLLDGCTEASERGQRALWGRGYQ